MARKKQPTAGKEFDELARKLLQVPKPELDREQKKYLRRRTRKKQKKD